MPEPEWPDDFNHAGPQYRLRGKAIEEAVAAERERCIKICEDSKLWSYPPGRGSHPFPANSIHREAAKAIADAIVRG